jgi:hypothetical protein
MTKIVMSWSFGFFLLSIIFSHSEKKELKKIRAIKRDSVVASKKKVNIKSKWSQVKFSTGVPKVSQLPFKPKAIPAKRLFHLPPIKSVVYNNLDSLLNYRCTNGEPIDSSVLKLKVYRYKLPDIGKYEVFYDQTEQRVDAMASFIKTHCDNMEYLYFGYLILYDPMTSKVLVLNVYNQYYIDAVHVRDFYVDKNSIIHLKDSGYTDGEDAHGKQTTEYLGAIKRTIRILKDGSIRISVNK